MTGAEPGDPVLSLPETALVRLMLVQGRDIVGMIECPAGQFYERTVGRSATFCDQVVNDSTVSRCHIRLVWEPQAACWYVEDLGSKNGTRLNGSSLRVYTPVPLKQNTCLTLGHLELTVITENADSLPPLFYETRPTERSTSLYRRLTANRYPSVPPWKRRE